MYRQSPDRFADKESRMTDNASSRGLALLALILLVPAASIGTTFGMTLEASEGLTGQLVYGAAKVWLLIFPVFWLLAVDRGRLSWSPPRRESYQSRTTPLSLMTLL